MHINTHTYTHTYIHPRRGDMSILNKHKVTTFVVIRTTDLVQDM